MDRRDFLKGMAATGGGAMMLPSFAAVASAEEDATEPRASDSSRAMAGLRSTLEELEKSFEDPAWRLQGPADLAEARRYLAHTLQHALETLQESDPIYPAFVRFVTPEKKLLGDNPDAIYHTTPVSGKHAYRIHGNLAGASYTSFTVEQRKSGGASRKIGATLNDTQIELAEDGSFEIIASATEQPGNWLRLDPDAISITSRHYYERADSIAADRLHHIPLAIDNMGAPPPRSPSSEESVAAGLRRVAAFLQGTVVPPAAAGGAPRWVSEVPNQLPAPIRDSPNTEIGFAAVDNVYSMAPFVLRPDQALIIRGRFPRCRFANVVLWNRFMQTLDYTTRRVSLNRRQTQLEADGSFKIVIAGSDPGVPNWIDTEGRFVGTIFWRFLLPEEDIEPLVSQVVPLLGAAQA